MFEENLKVESVCVKNLISCNYLNFRVFSQFTTSLSDLENRTLWLTVWHSDMFGRNDFLGEVTLPLAGRIFDDPTPHWYQLQERVIKKTFFLIEKEFFSLKIFFFHLVRNG